MGNRPAATYAWKVSYLRRGADDFHFMGLTVKPGSSTDEFGVCAVDSWFHAYVDRSSTWKEWRQLGDGLAVQLHVELADLTLRPRKSGEIVGRRQRVLGVYVPRVCGSPVCRKVPSEPFLFVDGMRVQPRCVGHGGKVSLKTLSDALGVPVESVQRPDPMASMIASLGAADPWPHNRAQ
jgi:hypothetical protein